MPHQRPTLDWRETDAGRVPVSTLFDDPYYSLSGGLAEARYVFLDGNGLPERLHPGFQVAELGFGTGLNFLALAAALPDDIGPVHVTSFEAYPLERDQMAEAHAVFPEVTGLAARLREIVADALIDRVAFSDALTLRILPGDARRTLPAWGGRADAWFLDGFSPAKNPDMWEPSLLAAVVAHTAPGGTLATFTAAGHVRRALSDAGFEVARRQGFGRKRHMTVARMPR